MLQQYEDELAANFEQFTNRWPEEMERAFSELSEHDDHGDKFLRSYKRIVSINAWRSLIIQSTDSEGPVNFFVEAHNDAVSSHVFARLGSWRTALKSLRSCIENVLFCEFYKDHPVEFRKWKKSEHRITFQKLLKYFQTHPEIKELPNHLSGLPRLNSEYATLSQAVHSSAPSFRMTEGEEETRLWSTDRAKLGAWHTRERISLTGINLLLCALYREELQGAAQQGLRRAVSLTLSSSDLRDDIGDHLSINLSSL